MKSLKCAGRNRLYAVAQHEQYRKRNGDCLGGTAYQRPTPSHCPVHGADRHREEPGIPASSLLPVTLGPVCALCFAPQPTRGPGEETCLRRLSRSPSVPCRLIPSEDRPTQALLVGVRPGKFSHISVHQPSFFIGPEPHKLGG
jgi:hypothetical protein